MGTAKLQLNSTQIPHIILREWLPKLSDTELRIVLIIADQTYGWHKELDRIAYSLLIAKTGSSNGSIATALKSLRKQGYIQVTDENGNIIRTKEEARGKNLYYRINVASPKIGDDLSKNRTPKIGDTKETNTKEIISKDIIQKSDVGKIIDKRNQDVIRILEEFTKLTKYSQPTDRKPRYWAYLFARHKGFDNFRPCLKFLLEVKKYDLNKLETVYRKFPVYEAEVLMPKRKSAENFINYKITDRWGETI